MEQPNMAVVTRKLVLAGLADVWSNIRKDTARGLFKQQGKPQFLEGSQIRDIFEELVQWLEREGVTGNWQAVDGALHGINSILAHESDVQRENPGQHVLPDYLWTSVQERVCAPMFRHGQADIRTNAVQIFRTFLTFSRAQQERTSILKTVLGALRPSGGGGGGGGVDDGGTGANKQLLPDFEVRLPSIEAYLDTYLSVSFDLAAVLFPLFLMIFNVLRLFPCFLVSLFCVSLSLSFCGRQRAFCRLSLPSSATLQLGPAQLMR